MSHFLVGVILDKGSKNQDDVEELLAPYDENLETDAHDEKCWCVGRIANDRAEQEALKLLGLKSFDELRDKYNALPENLRPKWEDWTKPFMDIRKMALKGYDDKDAANPKCDDCKGSGTVVSHYNPLSKWDWWEVGGRWTGSLGDYDPYKDPDNYEPCNLCNGTGKRNDELGKEARAKDPKYTCNGCDGKGKSVKWHLKNKDNVVTVNSLLKHKDLGNKIPFALVTPDGEWHEKGEMGWWACVSNEKKDWDKEAIKILKKYRGHWIVAVDCHI